MEWYSVDFSVSGFFHSSLCLTRCQHVKWKLLLSLALISVDGSRQFSPFIIESLVNSLTPLRLDGRQYSTINISLPLTVSEKSSFCGMSA